MLKKITLIFVLSIAFAFYGNIETKAASSSIGNSSASQQEAPQPKNIPALKSLLTKKMDVLWMGRKNGLDGWLATQGESIGVFYTTPDGKALVSGQMFDENGQSITRQQIDAVKNMKGPIPALIAKAEKQAAANMTAAAQATSSRASTSVTNPTSPSEKLYAQLESSAWFPIGSAKAPILYFVFDPTCSHCKAYFADLYEKAISKDLLQVRMVPVGLLTNDSADIGVRILAASDPTAIWAQVLAGKEAPVPSLEPAKLDTIKNEVSHNTEMFSSWSFEGVPISVYRDKNGKVILVKGKAKSVETLLATMTPS